VDYPAAGTSLNDFLSPAGYTNVARPPATTAAVVVPAGEDPAEIDKLAAMLESHLPEVRLQARARLAAMYPASAAALVQALGRWSNETFNEAQRTFLAIGSAAVPALLEALGSEQLYVRCHARALLAQLDPGADAVPALVEGLVFGAGEVAGRPLCAKRARDNRWLQALCRGRSVRINMAKHKRTAAGERPLVGAPERSPGGRSRQASSCRWWDEARATRRRRKVRLWRRLGPAHGCPSSIANASLPAVLRVAGGAAASRATITGSGGQPPGDPCARRARSLAGNRPETNRAGACSSRRGRHVDQAAAQPSRGPRRVLACVCGTAAR
jgi:hypothetical protein